MHIKTAGDWETRMQKYEAANRQRQISRGIGNTAHARHRHSKRRGRWRDTELDRDRHHMIGSHAYP